MILVNNLLEIMSQGQPQDELITHKKYSKISLKKRQSLIQLVIEKGESLTKTSKKLNIKLSTAKLILRKYRKTGVLFNKNMNVKCKKGSKDKTLSSYVKQQTNIVNEQIKIKQQESAIAEPTVKIQPNNIEPFTFSSLYSSLFYPVHQPNWIIYPGVLPYP